MFISTHFYLIESLSKKIKKKGDGRGWKKEKRRAIRDVSNVSDVSDQRGREEGRRKKGVTVGWRVKLERTFLVMGKPIDFCLGRGRTSASASASGTGTGADSPICRTRGQATGHEIT